MERPPLARDPPCQSCGQTFRAKWPAGRALADRRSRNGRDQRLWERILSVVISRNATRYQSPNCNSNTKASISIAQSVSFASLRPRVSFANKVGRIDEANSRRGRGDIDGHYGGRVSGAQRPSVCCGERLSFSSRQLQDVHLLASSALSGAKWRGLAFAAGVATMFGASPVFAQCYSTTTGLAGNCSAIVPTGSDATAIGQGANAAGGTASAFRVRRSRQRRRRDSGGFSERRDRLCRERFRQSLRQRRFGSAATATGAGSIANGEFRDRQR